MKKNITPLSVFIYLVAVLWSFLTLYPYLFMFITSFKSNSEFMSGNTFGLPKDFFIGNYIEVLSGRFPLYLKNSIIVTGLSVFLTLMFASMAAYVFARLSNGVVSKANAVVVACMSIPIHVAFIPVFILARKLGIYDTIWVLIPVYVTFNLPAACFIMTGFMKTIPREIEEAAQIDGASLFRTYLEVALPLSRPAFVTLGIYVGCHVWNEFSFAMILTNKLENRTLPLAPWDYRTEYTSNTAAILTVLALSTLPMLIVYAFSSEKLVKGMVSGAVKG
ncbi:MAG: carbohydrate ABC transporter permease [Bacillota bacterium]|nr:carbohydrate ABC transporter permease [Bacillota bacterium]